MVQPGYRPRSDMGEDMEHFRLTLIRVRHDDGSEGAVLYHQPGRRGGVFVILSAAGDFWAVGRSQREISTMLSDARAWGIVGLDLRTGDDIFSDDSRYSYTDDDEDDDDDDVEDDGAYYAVRPHLCDEE
jgi:hypothetical protein